MKTLRRAILATLLMLAAGAFATVSTATACPGADKATTADSGD